MEIGINHEMYLSSLLALWACVLLIILTVNLFTRLLVRYSEARGIIRISKSYSREVVPAVRTPFGVVNSIVNDVIDTVKYFTLKAALWTHASIQFVLLHESRGLSSSVRHDRGRPTKNAELIQERDVYLLRHGQSVWNLMFNNSSFWQFPIRFIVTLIAEMMLFCDYDSLFMDSPLSSGGLHQCRQLSQWVDAGGDGDGSKGSVQDRDRLARLMNGVDPCVYVASNLRRTISTMIFSWGSTLRTSSANKKVYINSDLQESTRNVDSFSIVGTRMSHSMSTLERSFGSTDLANVYHDTSFVTTYNKGNKTLNSTLSYRQAGFMDWIMGSTVTSNPDIPIVMSCHSLYARNLFRRYLSCTKEVPHVSTLQKISNCGVVKAKFQQWRDASGELFFSIDTSSVVPLYKGFA